MKQKVSILLLLCVAVLLPSIAMAQSLSVFAKQRVVIADIFNNSDREINPAIKKLIYQGFRDVVSNSSEYEVYEVNVEEIKRELQLKGVSPTPQKICQKIGEKADFIIFTNIKTSASAYGAQAQNVTIFISTSLYRIKTATEIMADQGRSKPDEKELLSVTSALMARMLGINGGTRTASIAHSAEKTYKVGDYCVANGKQGVVFVVTPDGKHGKMISLNQASSKLNWSNAKAWCSNLGSGWRLPTKAELVLIYKNKAALNSTLAAIGDEITDYYHWSSSEYSSECALDVSMSDGSAGYRNKYSNLFVRAVSAF